MTERLHSHPTLSLLTELLSVPSPSGHEERMAALIRQKLKSMGYEPGTDPAGNVLVRFPGRDHTAPLLMLAAHMDEIGLVVTAIDADGSLRVDRSGGLYPYKTGERAVDIVGDDAIIAGVLSIGAGHGSDFATRAVMWKDVKIITGCSPRQLAAKGVRVGSMAVPSREGRGPVILGEDDDPLIGAWTFDDRGGLIALLLLLEMLHKGSITPAQPTIVAFTIHEEGGCYGAKVLAHRERPEMFIAVDGCPLQPGSQVVADGRPAVWAKDGKGHYDPRLVRAFLQAGREIGQELQVAVLASAYSDASAVYDAGAAPRVGIVGHARENSHGFEVARLSVFENVARVLSQFAQAKW